MRRRYGDEVAVLAVAVESDSAAVVKTARTTGLPLRWALGTPDLARAFGDLSAVPTLFVFGRDGRAAGAFLGAPPTLHAEAGAAIEAALGRGPASPGAGAPAR